MLNKGGQLWWFIEKEEQKEIRCYYFGFSQFEIGMFRICRKIAKPEARKVEPDRLELAQEAKAWSVLVWMSVAVFFSWENLKVIFF